MASWNTTPFELSTNTAMLDAPAAPAVVGAVERASPARTSKFSMRALVSPVRVRAVPPGVDGLRPV
jgi:hypothetical protein